MSRAHISTVALFLVAGLVAFGQHPKAPNRKKSTAPCLDRAKTQAEMNGCAASDFTRLDREMNALYEALLAKHKDDRVVVEKLHLVQDAWLKYRDAYMEAWYPEPDKRFYGSVEPMCRGLMLAALTQERVQTLKDMLAPVEGDVCGFWTEPK